MFQEIRLRGYPSAKTMKSLKVSSLTGMRGLERSFLSKIKQEAIMVLFRQCKKWHMDKELKKFKLAAAVLHSLSSGNPGICDHSSQASPRWFIKYQGPEGWVREHKPE